MTKRRALSRPTLLPSTPRDISQASDMTSYTKNLTLEQLVRPPSLGVKFTADKATTRRAAQRSRSRTRPRPQSRLGSRPISWPMDRGGTTGRSDRCHSLSLGPGLGRRRRDRHRCSGGSAGVTPRASSASDSALRVRRVGVVACRHSQSPFRRPLRASTPATGTSTSTSPPADRPP